MSRSFQVQEKWQMQSFSTTICIDRNINFHPRRVFNPSNLKALSLQKKQTLGWLFQSKMQQQNRFSWVT
jgi:hypothetical protein